VANTIIVSYEGLTNIVRKLSNLHPLIYLASPYSKYPRGLDAAHHDICVIAGKLKGLGLYAFCPIAHCHYIAKVCDFDSSYNFSAEFNKLMISRSDIFVIAMLDGWDQSEGVAGEKEHALLLRRPIYHLVVQERIVG
jgi:hypothetical protein